MILSFYDEETKAIWEGSFSKKIKLPTNLHNIARRKLRMIYAATIVETLKLPPGNQLEKLTGNRNGQFSIRINSQWRICFNWSEGNACDVEICDYH
ncbi:MAG: type II toxin-antitoxin system RelE/ParE family toxin [Leptospiraceae bacterium]|nr:type II toxin-antitoxin system RelE/ParE family toxin [Leptospiraceae bacterium]MCK6380544.1 type II toxin-antitoxin system RelE/ParE family toxin [Leptospiraceae bacterium]NUM41773.1 type II toxin-antitoxin system RelE/ParE family toxin [Leptospiraceae bacterium]